MTDKVVAFPPQAKEAASDKEMQRVFAQDPSVDPGPVLEDLDAFIPAAEEVHLLPPFM